MEYYQVPVGFGMALALNEQAMAAYAAMSEQQKQGILGQAHHAHTAEDMRRLVDSLADTTS